MRNGKSTLLKRRTTAIIIASALVVLLAVSLVLVLDFVNSTAVEVDGTTYYVREKKNVYALYDTDKKTVLPTEEQYGYYVTHAGTLVEVDAETGEYEIIASVDTEGNEALDFDRRVLIYPHLQKKDILKIEVHNSEGEYTFVRQDLETGEENASAAFVIKGSPITGYDQELFASLHVSCGYTLTSLKLADPIKDANGQFSEYGLVPETRKREKLDEDGEFVLDEDLEYVYEEYEYTPAYYVITDISGNSYKLIIGDRLVTGGGYYVQYEDTASGVRRDAVYVLGTEIAETLLAPIEDFVEAQLVYPMTMNTYLWANKFFVWQRNESYDPADESSEKYTMPIYASFVALDDREGTINQNTAYVFEKGFSLEGYEVSSTTMMSALESIYMPTYNNVVRLNPTDEELVKYGISVQTGTDQNGHPIYSLDSQYILSFNYDEYDDSESTVLNSINNRVYISELDGKFYAYTMITPLDKDGNMDAKKAYSLNMIIEVAPYSLSFLKLDRYDWIDKAFSSINIGYTQKIEIVDHVSGYSSSFTLDNSKTPESENISTTMMSVIGSDSSGNSIETFSNLTFVDASGNTWVVTSREIYCYSPSGKEIESIPSARYTYNSIGRQVRICENKIVCADGSYVTVNADTVLIEGAQSKTVVRYGTDLFRKLFSSITTSTISDSYSMSAAEEQELLADSSKALLTIKITNTLGEQKEYKFYRLTSRKAYITVNGNGGFYVLASRLDKIVADSQRFFALEDIDSAGKY